ncbi:MAG TPA: PD-(D/E)XK nuclease family protein [Candidatus Polarisedimenticolaceae bacterium]|nr:PD-(D/E)XK nuclease family protein [Candidatus Polarisedimenticolaceae bacterium]
MKILAHPDPLVLERELVDRVAAARPGPGSARVLVVVPTARLADHVERRLAAARRAWLGVEVRHFRSLVWQILDEAGVTAPQLLSARLLEACLGRLVEGIDDPLGRFVRRRPGTVRSLLASFGELREAGVAPADLEAVATAGPDRALAALYGRYAAELERLASRGWVDDAGLVRAALPRARAYVRQRGPVLVHGVYETTGIHLDLLRELDRGRGVTLLLPAAPGAAVSSYAERFAAHYLAGGAAIEPLAASIGERLPLAALYEEDERPEAAAAGRVVLRHAQGAAAEVRAALRSALAACSAGCPAEEIALVARTLAPYGAALEEAFDAEGLPWTSSLHSPLRRQPEVHDLLLLARVLAENFPRRATAELLRSPRLRWREILDEHEPLPGDRADVWSRQARIVGGFDEWTVELPRWAAEVRPREDAERAQRRAEQAQRVARALAHVRDALRPDEPRSWSAHASDFEAVLERWLLADDDPAAAGAREAVREILADLRRMETVVDESAPVPFDRVAAWLESAVDSTALAQRQADAGGIRVLDATQARGMTFRRVLLLGLNGGQFPRPVREDPFLSDALRRELRRRTGRPLGVSDERGGEERLLLALLLGGATERLEISWQRADESGKARAPSLALREIARAGLGRPSLRAALDAATHVPSHPLHNLEQQLEATGLLSPEEERILTALRATGPEGSLDARYPELAAGLRLLRATEAFHGTAAAYDGRIGEGAAPPASLSVSDLETLGRCPLQFFFKCVLRVHELEDPADPFLLRSKDLGGEIHRLMEQLYRTLQAEDSFGTPSAEPLVGRAAELLETLWVQIAGSEGRRLATRLPVLWGLLSQEWKQELGRRITQDLSRLAGGGWRPAAFEESRTATLDLAPGRQLELRARFDRRFEGPQGTLVGDYKVSRRIRERLDVTNWLSARELQVPLYGLIAGQGGTEARVELLPLHPRLAARDAAVSDWTAPPLRQLAADVQAGLIETLTTLLDLLRGGSFPLAPPDACDWCAYRRACRFNHPPTLEREQASTDSLAYRQTRLKNKSKKPTLAKVRATQATGVETEG